MRRYTFPPMGVLRNVAEPPKPRAFPPVRIHVLRPFFGAKRLLKAGELVSLPEPDAPDAVALNRAEFA